MKKVYLIIVCLVFAKASLAAPSCMMLFSKGLMGGALGHGEIVDYSLYENHQNMLFLSDGIKDTFGYRSEVRNEAGAFSLGERVASRFPNKDVTQGDFNIQGDKTDGNLRQMFLDNTQVFPFPDGAFDLVILRKGLCLCACNAPCAGFKTKYQSSKSFFENVIRVLDLENPHSLAALHGQQGANSKVTQRWKRIARELEADYPVEFLFRPAPSHLRFQRGDNSISDRPRIVESMRGLERDLNAIYIRPRGSNRPWPPL